MPGFLQRQPSGRRLKSAVPIRHSTLRTAICSDGMNYGRRSLTTSAWRRRLRCRCHWTLSWRTRSRSGTRWSRSMGLLGIPINDVSSWRFGDFVFSWDYDFFADGTKARRLGFHEFVDTEAMFMNIFDDFRRRKVIP